MTTPNPAQPDLNRMSHEQRMEYWAAQTARSTRSAANSLTFFVVLQLITIFVAILFVAGAFE